MRAKANLIAGNLEKRLGKRAHGRYRFITLTLKHSAQDLPAQIKRLYTSFRKLRATPLWKNQSGGAYVLECKRGRDRQWHPHLHIISEGYYLPGVELSATWHQITGDSWVTDIRSIDNAGDVTRELTKYITKSTDASVWQSRELSIEWVVAMRGTRCCATYGTWRKWKLTEKPADPKDWQPVCTLTELMSAVHRRERWAVELLIELRPPGLSDELRDYLNDTS